MPHVRLLLVALLALVVPAASALAAPRAALTCNPHGSWVANTAETNRFFHSVNPTQTTISVQRGALTATFDHGKLTYGALSLTLVGELGTSRIKEVVDMQTIAPYRMRGSKLVLSRGAYTLHVISAVLSGPGGSKRIRIPDQHHVTKPNSVAIACSATTLRWTVPTGPTRGVSLNFRRAG
jgi:hypothetical protein